MRNPVASPASIIFGILLLGFIVLFAYSALSITKQTFILEQHRWTFTWYRAFLLFTESFIALMCSGALISYSLFLGVPVFFERRALFRYLTSVVVSLTVLVALFIVCREGVAPLMRRQWRETRSLALFSDSLFREALKKKAAGDRVTALEYVSYSILTDGRNPEKIAEKTSLLSSLSDAEYAAYLGRTTGEDRRDEFDVAAALARARTALDRKRFGPAYDYARAVLSVDRANVEALRIEGIAGEKSYRESSRKAAEDAGYLYRRKKEGADALAAGRAGSARDAVSAYYIFTDLRSRFPADESVADYRREAEGLLGTVSFFTDDAELVLAFDSLAVKDVVFFNSIKDDERELVSIERLVEAGGRTYFRNVEVAGFTRSGRLLYHYLAPYGKAVGQYINLTGLDRKDPARQTAVRTIAGAPPLDRERGIKLSLAPADLRSLALTPADLEEQSLGELFSLLPPMRNQSLFAAYAARDELILREIVLHLARPVLLLLLSLFCMCIGLTQNARYLASTPKLIYVWVPVIPFVMIAVMELFLFLHRMGAVFLFYSLGAVIGTIVIAALHVFFLILSLLRFGGKIGASLRR